MKILNENENKLLKRKEVVAQLEASGETPSRKNVKSQIAKKFKVDEKLVVIAGMQSHFGAKLVDIEAFVYVNQKALEKVSATHIAKRNVFEEAKKEKVSAPEAPAEKVAPQEETPKEAPKTEEKAPVEEAKEEN